MPTHLHAHAARARALLDGEPLAWLDVCAAVRAAGPFWLSTVDRDGAPHSRPVLAVWLDGVPHLAASPSSRKANHLAGDPRCALAVSVTGLDVVVEGRSAVVHEPAALDLVAAAYAQDYGWIVEVRDGALWAEGAPTAGPAPYEVHRISPAVAHAFGTDEKTAPRSTRWTWTARDPR
jgi:hypothetical protein